ncbi:hypothetical protein Vadar_029940 [Vaccinium darrowii]|uniref:Uncharacterized protein n=1 Tax=Vaccinium darrowii TaxID=229202 RepID=A0ACB7Z7T3_9ERIC|nr:hypothetical protein Vadar_029940 [Vaccinium darrowii]
MIDNAEALISLFGSEYSASTNFIASSCNATRYPSVCLQSLWGYSIQLHQSIDQVAKIALAVSLARAKSTEEFVKRLEQGARSQIRSPSSEKRTRTPAVNLHQHSRNYHHPNQEEDDKELWKEIEMAMVEGYGGLVESRFGG